MISILLLNCCVNIQKNVIDKVPEPPENIIYDETSDCVIIPFNYWIKLNKYIISVEESF